MNPILVGIFQILAGYGIGVEDVAYFFMLLGFAGLILVIFLLATQGCHVR
jgi:hypothetical protein